MTITDAPPSETAPTRPGRRRAPARIGWVAITLTSLAIVAFAVTPYLTATLAESSGGLAPAYAEKSAFVQTALYVHIVAGGLALLAGPWQFAAGLRRRRPGLHRAVGKVYVGAVLVGGVAGLLLAPFNTAGLVGTAGFGTLAVLWLWTTWRGYRAIRGGDVRSHQSWMIRSFALTYAAVMLRVWTGLGVALYAVVVGDSFDFEAAFEDVYLLVPFLCWLPNVVVAEILLRRRGLPALRIVDGGSPARVADRAPTAALTTTGRGAAG